MRILKRFIQVIIWLFLITILFYNLYTYICLNILDREVVSINGYTALEVVSGSMEPTFDVGDVIIINQKKKDYKEKDIITFKDENFSYVTHRIEKITDKGIVTKGDANSSTDEGYIESDDIVGVYVMRISKVGYIIKSIKNPITLILIFIIGVISCIVFSTDKDGVPLDISEEEKEYRKRKNNDKLKK